MLRRLVHVLTAAALFASPALAVPSSGAAARPDFTVAAPSRFSPNGDGVQDTLRIRYTLPARTHVWLAIGDASSRVTNRRVDLGVQPEGTHEWTWNGRNQSGKVVSDRAYQVRLYDTVPGSQGFATWRASDKVQVDTHFSPTLIAPTFGAPTGAPARVYPRTTAVTDTLPLTANVWDNKVDFFELVIRNARGRVVRRADVDERGTGPDRRPSFGTGRTVEWAAVRGGKPLPKGRYTAVARGRDLAGNAGRSDPLRIRVSDDRLEWQERTETVTPAGSVAQDYCVGSGCADFQPCGEVVPSARFAGGLSYRSVECTGEFKYSLATQDHALLVPDATGVRGIDSARVAFVGAPTTDHETDQGRLSLSTRGGPYVEVSGATGGQTVWSSNLVGAQGQVVEDHDGETVVIPPRVEWTFTTEGNDSVDVATFTVDVRYLAVAD